MILVPKLNLVRDPAWLKHQRENEPCIISGIRSHASETVDPSHVGAFKGMKRSDDETLPVLHQFHVEGHNGGEMTMWRKRIPDDVLRAALRALARERYRAWKGMAYEI